MIRYEDMSGIGKGIVARSQRGGNILVDDASADHEVSLHCSSLQSARNDKAIFESLSTNLNLPTTSILDDLIFDDKSDAIGLRESWNAYSAKNSVEVAKRLSTVPQASRQVPADDASSTVRRQSRSSYEFNCTNVGRIVLKHKLGRGVTKQVFLGIYRQPSTATRGSSRRHSVQRVAVKMVTADVVDISSCIRRLQIRSLSPSSSSSSSSSSSAPRRIVDDVWSLDGRHSRTLTRTMK
jgi:hypothetical protein